jgi:hypothetical protein
VPQKTLRNAVLKILLDHPEWNIQEQERDKYCEAQSKRLKIMRRDVDQEVWSPSMISTPTPHHAPPATTNNFTTNIGRPPAATTAQTAHTHTPHTTPFTPTRPLLTVGFWFGFPVSECVDTAVGSTNLNLTVQTVRDVRYH